MLQEEDYVARMMVKKWGPSASWRCDVSPGELTAELLVGYKETNLNLVKSPVKAFLFLAVKSTPNFYRISLNFNSTLTQQTLIT